MKPILFLLALAMSVSAQDVNVTLTWDKHPEPDVDGYFVHYGTKSGVYTATVPSSTNLVTIAIPKGMRM